MIVIAREFKWEVCREWYQTRYLLFFLNIVSSHSIIAGTTTVNLEGELQTLVFALKNTCDGATMSVGIINIASLGFILLSVAALSLYQRRKQIQFDEQEQTAQDYSIEVWNPPGDATEPEEWKDFFESRFGGHVTCCTVTIDNDLLVKALAERREVLMQIEERIPDGTSMESLEELSAKAAKVEHGRMFTVSYLFEHFVMKAVIMYCFLLVSL